LPGYRLRIVDGTCLAATDRRLMRFACLHKPLPGKVIAVLDPQTKLVTDIFPCPDGHAQERSLFNEVLERVQPLMERRP